MSLRGERQSIFPASGHVKFEMTVKNEPKISKLSQVIVADALQVYAPLYPKYRVGERLSIEGYIEGGRIFQPKIEKVGKEESLAAFRSRVRNQISTNIAAVLPDREATLVLGTVLGVDNINKEFQNDLIKTGTIHVVVVSGQNLMIVAGVFLAMAKYVGKRQSLVLALLAVFAYALLTGFEPPVVRATIMVLVSTLAIFLGREANVIWSILMAGLAIVLIWPQALFEVSFQLTFAATLGIVTLGQRLVGIFENFLDHFAPGPVAEADAGPVSRFPPASARSSSKSGESTNSVELRAVGSPSTTATLKNAWRLFAQNAAVAISAYVFTAPVILYYFGQVSPIAPLANIFVVEAVAPVMALGFLIAFASLIFMPLAQILAYLAFVPTFYFVKVVQVFAKLPVEQISVGKGSVVLVIIFYVGILAVMGIWGSKNRKSET